MGIRYMCGPAASPAMSGMPLGAEVIDQLGSRVAETRPCMPVLKNPKHERFAQEVAKGLSAAQAYEKAGYAPNRHNASALAQKQPIQARVSELLEKREQVHSQATAAAIEKTGLTQAGRER